jgi:ubiquinone/menaquinone biosynthesis C-methylase UbiE
MAKKPSLDAAYALQSPDDNRLLYADWAKTYDCDFAKNMGYALPIRVADAFAAKLNGSQNGRILDVGAGTGLVGQRLNSHGYSNIDGLDISPEMLEVARAKGCYENMIEGDLLSRLLIPDNTYNYIISAGTFTHGHVGASALDELLRISKPGALFCIAINSTYFSSTGFEKKFHQLSKKITQLEFITVQIYFEGDHTDGEGVVAIFRSV